MAEPQEAVDCRRRGANWLCASRQPGDVLTTETGDGQVDKLLRVVGHDKTEAALYGPGPSRIRPGTGVCEECRGIRAFSLENSVRNPGGFTW